MIMTPQMSKQHIESLASTAWFRFKAEGGKILRADNAEDLNVTTCSQLLEFMGKKIQQQKAQLQSFTSYMQHQVDYQTQLLGFIHGFKESSTHKSAKQ